MLKPSFLYSNFTNKWLVDKYIFIEFIGPFLFSLGLFLAITVSGFVLFNLIDLMVKYGISLELFLKLFLFSLPEMILYSIPMSVLLACILTSGRLYRDNEITIFQSSGRHNFRLFLPVFIFTIFLSLISIFFNYSIVSKANNEFSKNSFYAQMKKNLPVYKQNIFYKDFERGILKRSFYAREFNNGVMANPVLEEFENGIIIRIVQAQKAQLENGNWIFQDGNIYNISDGKYNSFSKFDRYSFAFLPGLESIAGEIRSPKEMNYSELAEYINNLKLSGEKTSALEVQLHQKIAVPLTSAIFFLIGIPLGLSKKSKTSSFGFAFSLIFIFCYYITMFAFTALGSTEHLNPVIAAWMPDILTLTLGIFLILSV